MSAKQFKEKKIANLVNRREYSSVQMPEGFELPNLLEIQKSSYERFINKELGVLMSHYFPISHEKNKNFEIRYAGMKLSNPNLSEEECRKQGKSYEKGLYLDLQLINNQTGEVEKNKKGKGKEGRAMDGV
jgi:DNA-directed RNA polymerase subunit beta